MGSHGSQSTTSQRSQVDPFSMTRNEMFRLPEPLNNWTQYEDMDFVNRKLNESTFRWQMKVYDFLNRPSRVLAFLYHIVLVLIILVYLSFVMFTERIIWHESCSSYENQQKWKAIFEHLIIGYFVIITAVRLWCSRAVHTYSFKTTAQWLGLYFIKPSHIFDVLLLVSGLIASSCQTIIPFDFIQDVYALICIRELHRAFNVARWISVQSRVSPWIVMTEVFHDSGYLLFCLVYIELLVTFLLAYLMYLVEYCWGDGKSQIDNMGNALYYMEITLITVGYGDFTPVRFVYPKRLRKISISSII